MLSSKLFRLPVNKGFRRFLTVKSLPTPNENALKFTVDQKLLPFSKTLEFNNTLSAIHSPLALRLFKIPGVKSIMIGEDFLTVNKADYIMWGNLRPEVKDLLIEHITSNQPIITDQLIKETNELDLEEDEDEIISMIKELIETRIRPAIQDDGGDIEFRGFDEATGKVFLKLQGACKSCSASEDTLKGGIESMLKHYIDEVNEVEQILDPEEEVALKEFQRLENSLKSRKEEAPPPSL